jgi:hypothetical protein
MKKFCLTTEIRARVEIYHDDDDPIEAETEEQAIEFAKNEARKALDSGEFDIDEEMVYDIVEIIEDEDE